MSKLNPSAIAEEIIDLRWAKPVFAPGDQIAVSADGNKLDEDDIGGQVWLPPMLVVDLSMTKPIHVLAVIGNTQLISEHTPEKALRLSAQCLCLSFRRCHLRTLSLDVYWLDSMSLMQLRCCC